MVYNYDKTTLLIRDFCDLPDNPRPKTIFDPCISMPNTQLYLRYPEYASDIKYIEGELPEYLYHFEDYPKPIVTGRMFSGRSPLNRKKK